MAKHTPFYQRHIEAGAKLIEFAGFEMPLQYKGIIPEHLKVREGVGVFDVSHMGRIEIKGKDSLKFVNWLITNDASSLVPYQAQYAAMCYPDGGIVDDLVVYRLPDEFLLVVNAANMEKDYRWMSENRIGDVEIINRTYEVSQLALQGPISEKLLQRLTDFDLSKIGYYRSAHCRIAGEEVFISRTGYTGEDGFELYIPKEKSLKIWDSLFKEGKEFGLEPIGLGARDTLRLEMKYCLYGNDIDASTNPLEAGLGWITKLNKPGGFIGAEVLKRVKEKGIERRLVGFEMKGRDIPRPHFKIVKDEKEIGEVTSGTYSPSLKKGIGMGYVKIDYASIGTEIEILIRERKAKAVIIKPPFYKTPSHK